MLKEKMQELKSKRYAKGYRAIVELEILLEQSEIEEWRKEAIQELVNDYREVEEDISKELLS